MAFAVAFTFWGCDPEETAVELTCTVAKTDVTVYGGNDGTITVTVVTGNEGYEYTLTSTTTVTNTTGNFTGLVAGDYSVSIKDSKNKTWQKDVTIDQAAPSELSVTLELEHVSCHDGNNGKITVTATGGILTYVYKLGDGNYQDGNTFESLTAGDYTVTVKSGDFIVTKNTTITQPAVLEATHSVTHPTEPGGNGTITISATGGTTPYQYKLNDGEYQSSNTFSTTSGTHTVTVTDANSCGPFVISGITLTDPVPPTVTTKEITSITASTAISGGNVLSGGGVPVTARGVVWSTSEDPTLESNSGYTTDGEGTGEFESSITGLTPDKTYYVRAYSTNNAGTSYGNQQTFISLDGIIILTTSSITNITLTSALCGGSITSDGGATITACGVVWNTIEEPTLENNIGYTSDGEGTGEFESSLTNLTPGTTYYVRAYSTNSVGTSYGNQQTFNTLDGIIILTTASVTNFSATSVWSGGSITSDGGAEVTVRGVVWSTIEEPSLESCLGYTNDGSGIGTFNSILTNLQPSTIYYVRAYAINSEGTNYGNGLVFKTAPGNIGDSYLGGIIAYILQTGDPGYVAGEVHGLIAAPSDQSSGVVWGCYGTNIGSTSTAIGTGMANTLAIVNGCGTAEIAAKICHNLVLNGYNDWYLPSAEELKKLYNNRATIGGFEGYYWSSSEYENWAAWYVHFEFGAMSYAGKSDFFKVRPVRSF